MNKRMLAFVMVCLLVGSAAGYSVSWFQIVESEKRLSGLESDISYLNERTQNISSALKDLNSSLNELARALGYYPIISDKTRFVNATFEGGMYIFPFIDGKVGVPEGKVYEVWTTCAHGEGIILRTHIGDTIDKYMAQSTLSASDVLCPANIGYDGTAYLVSVSPNGWIMTEGMYLLTQAPVEVLYRDVTNMKGKGY